MSDYLDEGFGNIRNGWSGWHPSIRAALIFTVPFIIVDFFNYYSAGASLVISCPIQFLIYGACGALAGKFGQDDVDAPSNPMILGALAGAGLWTISTLVNTLISLILGTLSVGVTLLLGIPYLCICAPVFLILGSLTGLLGAVIYTSVFRKNTYDGTGYS